MSDSLDPYVTEVAPGTYAYIQPDGTWFINNAGFVVGDDGVVVIDTCATEKRTRALFDAISHVTDAPVRTVVNTHHHGDHTHGNCVAPDHASIVSSQPCRDLLIRTGINHYPEAFEQPEWGDLRFRAPDTTFVGRLDLWAGSTKIELHEIGFIAHTTNDVVAWLPEHRVLFTGDLVFNGGTPFVVMGSVAGSINSLDVLREFDADVVVAGHGPVTNPTVFDSIERYFRWVQHLAEQAVETGTSPLDIARNADLGEFASLTDPERLVGNLHRAIAELRGTEADYNVATAIADMLIYNGGRPLSCAA